MISTERLTAIWSSVVSNDGANISYFSMGSGPSVIVIPGALSVAADYAEFAQELARNFAVHVIERRGRGLSSPQGDGYSMIKERDDVLALQQHTGAAFLVGHSFGGLVALESARSNPSLSKVAVYEPGVSIGGSIRTDWVPRYEQALAKRKFFDAFVEFSLGTGPDQVRDTPRWLMKLLLPLFIKADRRKRMLGLLTENLREHREITRLDGRCESYQEIQAKVLLLYGGKTQSGWVTLAVKRLSTVLRHAETKEFPELGHFGIDQKAPQEVARTICAFFLEDSPL